MPALPQLQDRPQPQDRPILQDASAPEDPAAPEDHLVRPHEAAPSIGVSALVEDASPPVASAPLAVLAIPEADDVFEEILAQEQALAHVQSLTHTQSLADAQKLDNEASASVDEPAPAVVSASPQPKPAPQAVHGLIPDADLAALADDLEQLPPLETLDIVGSYDSGGTRFTMYSDGSVTAIGGDMDRRFPTLDALRKFIDGTPKG